MTTTSLDMLVNVFSQAPNHHGILLDHIQVCVDWINMCNDDHIWAFVYSDSINIVCSRHYFTTFNTQSQVHLHAPLESLSTTQRVCRLAWGRLWWRALTQTQAGTIVYPREIYWQGYYSHLLLEIDKEPFTSWLRATWRITGFWLVVNYFCMSEFQLCIGQPAKPQSQSGRQLIKLSSCDFYHQMELQDALNPPATCNPLYYFCAHGKDMTL